MTERFAILLLMGVVPVFFVGSYPVAFTYLALYNAAAVVLYLLDRRAIPQSAIEIQREHDSRWRLGCTQSMVLTIASEASVPLMIDVREDLPEGLESGESPVEESTLDVGLDNAEDLALVALGVGVGGVIDPSTEPRHRFKTGAQEGSSNEVINSDRGLPSTVELDPKTRSLTLEAPPSLVPTRVALPPRSTFRLTYGVTPRVRGALNLGPVHVRIHGPLGLSYIQRTVDVSSQVEISSPLPEDGRLTQVDPQPSVRDAGSMPSRIKGTGMELESLRQYTPGDAFRKINWKSSARRGKIIVRDNLEEVSQQILLMVDTSRLMGIELVADPSKSSSTTELSELRDGVRRRPHTRLDLAVQTAQLLANAALKQDDKVGLWAFEDEVVCFVKPARGHKHLVEIGARLQDLKPTDHPGSLINAVTHLVAVVSRRSLVILLTEPPPDREDWIESLGLLASRHRLLVLTLRDPTLERVAGEPRTTTVDDAFQRSAAASMLILRQATMMRLQEQGVRVVDLDPSFITLTELSRIIRAHTR